MPKSQARREPRRGLNERRRRKARSKAAAVTSSAAEVSRKRRHVGVEIVRALAVEDVERVGRTGRGAGHGDRRGVLHVPATTRVAIRHRQHRNPRRAEGIVRV
jgi:hypothetical protein